VRNTFSSEFFIFDVGSLTSESVSLLVELELLITHFCRINFNSVASAQYDCIIEYTSHIASNIRMTVVKFIFTTIYAIYYNICNILQYMQYITIYAIKTSQNHIQLNDYIFVNCQIITCKLE
jgi:hypothetical protein